MCAAIYPQYCIVDVYRTTAESSSQIMRKLYSDMKFTAKTNWFFLTTEWLPTLVVDKLKDSGYGRFGKIPHSDYYEDHGCNVNFEVCICNDSVTDVLRVVSVLWL